VFQKYLTRSSAGEHLAKSAAAAAAAADRAAF